MNLNVNIERIKANLLEVANISNQIPGQGYSRIAYSKEEEEALKWVQQKAKFISSGLKVRKDQLGNVFVRYGTKNKKTISFGSHLDTVPNGGLFDGALGVVLGLECIQVLVENNIETEVPLELICFVGEEANPLGGTFGSRALAGLIDYSSEFETILNENGFSWQNVTDSKLSSKYFHCFLETHIEQGPILEKEEKAIGVVQSISGLLRESVTVLGKASHSGTTPMNLRDDALVQASKLIHKINEIGKSYKGNLVTTVGELNIKPNLANVVPSEANLIVEIRGDSWEKLLEVKSNIRKWAKEHIHGEFNTIVEKMPCELSCHIKEKIKAACLKENVSYMKIQSGANHDSKSMKEITDTGMIFVPSHNGISHHPDEYTSWKDIEIGGQVMLDTIIELEKFYSKSSFLVQ